MDAQPIIKAVVTLLGSFALIVVLYFVIKRYANKVKTIKSTASMEILSKIGLPPKGYLYIVQVANKKLLLGVTEKSINTLAELSDTNSIISQSEDIPEGFQDIDMANFVPEVNKAYSKKELGFKSFVKSVFHK